MAIDERYSPLASVSATRNVLEQFGLATKHRLGQNFLINDDVIKKILNLAEVSSKDTVLEVGPGIGTLAIPLLTHSSLVVAIERDPDLLPVLEQTCAPYREKLVLIHSDALDITPESVAADLRKCCYDSQTPRPLLMPNKMVSNLPYAVAATVVLQYLEEFDGLESLTIMVQKEVADRMMASPGSKTYGAYTVKLGLFAKPVGSFKVGPGNFFPPPHVDSTVLRLDRYSPLDSHGEPLTRKEIDAACLMADAAFASRRKTLANSFKAFFSAWKGKEISSDFSSDKMSVALGTSFNRLFDEAGIDPKRRGETLGLSDFIGLGQVFLHLIR